MGMNCCCVDTGDNGPVTSDVTYPKARKDHRCCECRQTIKKGEEYERFSGLWEDGGWGVFKTCLPCSRMRDDLCGGSGIFGTLMEQINECLGEMGDTSDWIVGSKDVQKD